MFCSNCGHEIPDGARFCEYCGVPVIADGGPKEQEPSPDHGGEMGTGNGNTSGMGKGPKIAMIGAAVFLALILAGGVAYATVGLNMQKNRLTASIEKSEIPEYMEHKDSAVHDWNSLSFTDIKEKREVLEDLESIQEDVKAFGQCTEDVKKLQEEKEKYHMEDSVYGDYEELLEECGEAVKAKEAEEARELLEEAKESLEELVESNDSYIDGVVEMYEAADLSEAEKSETEAYEKHMDKIKELTGQEEKDYQAIKEEFTQMDEAIYLYIDPKNPLDISVQQVDATEFPKVKLYLNVKDVGTGEVPEDLDNAMFYIKKEDANAQYVKQVISNVNQLNEEEALKIDMVADVSGSMDGSPINEAKRIMCNFINSVQFSAGDMVELTSFSTGVRLEQEFCSDPNLLISEINGLYTGDMTSLYDALYTSVERVAAQTGARCVIAFTDGDDNYSNCTKEDVISVAQRYHVPVFIIGIGSSGYGDADYIAQQTGGVYYNVNDVVSMESIYEEIYRMEKEMYLLEFEDNTNAAVTDASNIETGYRSVEYGGECKYTYTPNILMSVDGSGIFSDGPEAVVEKYLKGFADAVTNSDFSYISDYLKPGSAIYQEQEQYVTRDITAQLSSFEIVSVDYSSQQNCVVVTRETYFVQVGNEPLQLMTQECKYAVEESGGEWKMTAFADKVKVLSRIKQ